MKFLVVIFIILAIICTSCSSSNNNKSIDDLVAFFNTNGMNVTNQSQKSYQLIGASDGCGMAVNGTKVEIYKFDTTVDGQKKILDNAKTKGTLSVMGFEVPVVINGSFMLVFGNNEVINMFNKF